MIQNLNILKILQLLRFKKFMLKHSISSKSVLQNTKETFFGLLTQCALRLRGITRFLKTH